MFENYILILFYKKQLIFLYVYDIIIHEVKK